MIDPRAWPALAAHSAAMESLDAFRKVQQPFVAPA